MTGIKLGLPSAPLSKSMARIFAEVKDQPPVDPVVRGSNRPLLMGLGQAPMLQSAFYETLCHNRASVSTLG